MSGISPVIPAGTARPFVAPHPDGGALVFWNERLWDPDAQHYFVSVFVSRIISDDHLSQPIELVQGIAGFSGLLLFSAPVIQADGSFNLLVSGSHNSDPVLEYSFASDFSQIGPPDIAEAQAPYHGTVGLSDTHLTFTTGETLVVDPDGQLELVSVDGTVLSGLSGQGNLRQASVADLVTGGFLLAIPNGDDGIEVRHYSVVDGMLQAPQRIDTFDHSPGFREPVIAALNSFGIVNERYVVITSTRNFGDVTDPADNVDTIQIRVVSMATGDVVSTDTVSFDAGTLVMSDAVVAMADGGFALAVHYRADGVGGTFAVRRYDANGVFRSEQIVGEGQGSSNNGGYDHQLVALDDGSLLITWQTSTPEGGRRGGHLFEILPPELHGTDDQDGLIGGDSDDLIFGYEGLNLLSGGAGDDTLVGGSGVDIFAIGDGTADVSASISGDDRMIGGHGNDSYYIDSTGDSIVEIAGEGQDAVYSTISVDLHSASQHVENLYLTGTDNIDGVGNALENLIIGNDGDNALHGGEGNDTLVSVNGADVIHGDAGTDVIRLTGDTYHTSGYAAFNVSSATQAGTQVRVNLEGLLRLEAVVDGGRQSDTIQLGDESEAFFLHDAYSGFHGSVVLSADYTGAESAARFTNIEEIFGMGGDDIIDLTSPDYSLAGVAMTIDGSDGNDIIWGSDADETILGGNGNDTIFGGIGTDVLSGGLGADVFEFTRTSTTTTVADFDVAQGDALHFYNARGAEFDALSVILTTDGITISFLDLTSNTSRDIDITLVSNGAELGLTLPEILSAIEIF